jgi:hypothetical protein
MAQEDRPPPAARRRAAKPASAAQAREVQRETQREVQRDVVREARPRRPAPRKTIQAKRSKDEALRAVRRFGDAPQEIPVTAYTSDGSQRTIVIRPTSIQDVYYYSAPR